MEEARRIRQNLDTNFLKLIAIVSMTVDHVGKIFFPGNMAMAVIGRIAFPLFAYCLVVGCLYTRDYGRYILRLTIFALISQPLYNLAFHPTWAEFWQEFFSLNIFFTLIAGVMAVQALMNFRQNWWMLLIALAMELLIGLDYGLYGIILMMIFYLCRNNSLLSALVVFMWMAISGIPGDFVHIGPLGLDRQFFAVLALPLIYLHTNVHPKINRYFFYAFYPAHLLLIFLARIALGI